MKDLIATVFLFTRTNGTLLMDRKSGFVCCGPLTTTVYFPETSFFKLTTNSNNKSTAAPDVPWLQLLICSTNIVPALFLCVLIKLKDF